MLSPAKLIRLGQELVFVLLGLLLIIVAALGRFLWDPKSQMWIVLGALLFVMGVRAWLRAGKYVTRLEHRVRGASLVLLGVCMLTITLAPYGWIAALLGAAGGVLALRGVVMAVLVLRTN
jgi:hypothetical protein